MSTFLRLLTLLLLFWLSACTPPIAASSSLTFSPSPTATLTSTEDRRVGQPFHP